MAISPTIQSTPRLSLVIPVFNERESLPDLYEQIATHVAHANKRMECIFVDDGSTDGSSEELMRLRRRGAVPCTIIRLRKNCGKSAALATGFAYARGQTIVTLDADLQDNPGDVATLINKLSEGYDLVVGWRIKRNDSRQKAWLSQIFNTVVSAVTGVKLHDHNIGLKAYRRQVVKELRLYGQLHRFIPVMAAARGFRIAEVPVTHRRRIHGSTKFGPGRILHAAWDLVATLFLLRFEREPLQLFGALGGLCALVGVGVLSYLSWVHFLGQNIGRRPLLLLGILFFLFGAQLILTGLVAELITSNRADKDYPIEQTL